MLPDQEVKDLMVLHQKKLHTDICLTHERTATISQLSPIKMFDHDDHVPKSPMPTLHQGTAGARIRRKPANMHWRFDSLSARRAAGLQAAECFLESFKVARFPDGLPMGETNAPGSLAF